MQERRSDCPIAFALDLFGDRWSLLVVRDLALKGRHTFSELAEAGEGIATNVLSDRLARLEQRGLVKKSRDPRDGRRFRYSLTEAGVDLLPVLVEIIVWSARHDPDSATPQAFVRAAKRDRAGLLRKLRRQLEARGA